MVRNGTMVLIKLPYWLGIGADGLWSVALFVPSVFAALTGTPAFEPDLQVRLIMAMGGSLMLGWTFLLAWAVQQPVERRFVILLTAFPVVLGMFMVALLGCLNGNTSNVCLLVKTVVLMVSMTASYVLSVRVARGEPSTA